MDPKNTKRIRRKIIRNTKGVRGPGHVKERTEIGLGLTQMNDTNDIIVKKGGDRGLAVWREIKPKSNRMSKQKKKGILALIWPCTEKEFSC